VERTRCNDAVVQLNENSPPVCILRRVCYHPQYSWLIYIYFKIKVMVKVKINPTLNP
jgi:hypothetical protein